MIHTQLPGGVVHPGVKNLELSQDKHLLDAVPEQVKHVAAQAFIIFLALILKSFVPVHIIFPYYKSPASKYPG